ncbi:MAG: response regulator receiver protein [Deltaproteobacteria bacterium]|nr:response regulator receiver protein [Deltaproteobacteria bacterium]
MIHKILLVDDSPIARKILKSCMPKDREYEFHEAGDGQEGLNKFLEIKPDVTFLDITMPVMDGIESLEAMKNADKNAVIIMCTADIQPKSILRVAALGALTVIKKPPSKDTVQRALLKAEETLRQPGEN